MSSLFEVPPLEPDPPYEDLPEMFAQFQAVAAAAGADFKEMARDWVVQAGGRIDSERFRVGDYPTDGLVCGSNGARYILLARGTPDDGLRAGLRRTDTVLKMGLRAVMIARGSDLPILVVASHLPRPGTRAGRILADLHRHADILDAVAQRGDLAGFLRLRRHLTESPPPGPLPSPWRDSYPQPDLFEGAAPDA